ncbi:hypothetical protein BDV98DRAFT_114364 [Pterulicium gracile]|uniref:Uncharacterized protein n=1 Tax=Pterulicium gracile TaxID=1884261 RepID=A0A5C3QPY1_9AGAR|nr:hypothetical protein BDV98DRAFT_114364 [Pterula gracilis]
MNSSALPFNLCIHPRLDSIITYLWSSTDYGYLNLSETARALFLILDRSLTPS